MNDHIATGVCPDCGAHAPKLPVHLYDIATNKTLCAWCGQWWAQGGVPAVVEKRRGAGADG